MILDLRFAQHPYKILIQTNVVNIPERLRAIDPSYFVVFNTKTDKFEVHSTDNKGYDTHCFTVPYSELDHRTIVLAKKGDMRTRGDKFFQELYEEEIKREKSEEREYRNTIQSLARETRSLFNGRIIVGG